MIKVFIDISSKYLIKKLKDNINHFVYIAINNFLRIMFDNDVDKHYHQESVEIHKMINFYHDFSLKFNGFLAK